MKNENNMFVILLLQLSRIPFVDATFLCLEHLFSHLMPQNVFTVCSSGCSVVGIKNSTVTYVNLVLDSNTLYKLDKPSLYVFVKVDLEKLDKFLSKLYRTRAWGSDVKTLFYKYETDQLNILFQLAWKYLMINVLAVTVQQKVYTYYPVSVGKCKNVFYYELGQCLNVRFGGNVFNESAALTFDDCTVKQMLVTVHPIVFNDGDVHVGFDEQVYNEIMLKLRIKSTTVPHNYPHWGVRLGNQNYTFLWKELYDGKIDVVTNQALKVQFLHDFDYSIEYSTLVIPYWTPNPSEVPRWSHLTLVFTWQIWLSIALTSVILSLSCLICKLGETGEYSSMEYCILNVWRSLVSPINTLPSSRALKSLFLYWSLFCFIITNSYQGFMISALFRRLYEPQLNTLEDLANSNLMYGGHPVIAERIHEVHTPASDKIFINYILCTVKIDCLLRVVQQRDFAVFKSTHVVHYNIDTTRELLIYPDGSLKMSRSTFEMKFDNVFYIRKGSPYLKRMNDLILRLKESGIPLKWDVYEKFPGYAIEANSFEKISLSHLYLAFGAVGVGLALAILVFVVEAKSPTKPIY